MIAKRKYTIDSLIGKTCGHGSPGYHGGTPEVIEAIFPYTGKPLNVFVNQELWQINFESGCFTYLKDEDLQYLLKVGKTDYWRAAGFAAMEMIEVYDQPDEVHDGADRFETCNYCED
jgi:hypothetical protein